MPSIKFYLSIRALFVTRRMSRICHYEQRRHSTKHGLDWTIGLDSWTGQLDWTVGLDYWTGFRMGFFPLNRRNLTDSKVYGMFLRKTK